jgi:hypothetical protein
LISGKRRNDEEICLYSFLNYGHDIATTSFAIKFDIWETGMSINEVVSLANKHDIPIARENMYHGYKKFSPKLIDDNFYKASSLYYRTNVSGHQSIVYLRLTNDSKFIREIEVRLFGIKNREDFRQEMIKILSQKYGQHQVVQGFGFKAHQWKPDPTSQVLMRDSAAEVGIIYTDLKIKEAQEEERRQKDIGKIRKDEKKF